MGYFLLFEGMLDSVIYARDNYLSDDGMLLPNRCSICLLGYGDERKHKELIQFWENVYGFDMSSLQKEVLSEAVVDICEENFILTESNIICDLDLMKVDTNCTNFSYNFQLIVTVSGKLTALVGYFDTFFELPNPVSFSTSPNTKPTHWKQVLFYLKKPVNVEVGEIITGKFSCQRNKKDVRALVIQIEMFNLVMKYHLN